MSLRSWWVGVACAGILVMLAGCSKESGGGESASGVGSVPPAAAKTVAFASDVKPILDKYCQRCHLDGATKGGLNLDSRENALRPGRRGPRIIEGNGEGSALVQCAAQVNGVKRMPPKGPAVTADEVATLRAWIDQGAKWE